ncbi:MAG: LysM peptidoglycan-binding domain-containing protein [Chloroflexi bacterium]|nr:MAG: LysM peptidoglycan-binding domain-containing protein [Chloroflexota bacterium]
MRSVREFGNALVAAFLSIGLTLGALSISLVGFVPEETEVSTLTPIPSPIPVTATNTFPPTSTLISTITSSTFTATSTIAQSTNCPPPTGWILIYVQPGDTLESLAARYGTTGEILRGGNCLVSSSLLPGTRIFVPNQPTSIPAACTPGAAGWIKNYVVKANDTLFSIALAYSTTLDALKKVNCRRTEVIFAGEILWVPNVTPRTPTKSATITQNITATPLFTEPGTSLPFTGTPTLTQTPIPPTSTPSSTVTPIPTQTASLTPFPITTPSP